MTTAKKLLVSHAICILVFTAWAIFNAITGYWIPAAVSLLCTLPWIFWFIATYKEFIQEKEEETQSS